MIFGTGQNRIKLYQNNHEMHPSILLVEDDEDDVFLFRDTLLEINPHSKLLNAINGLEAIKELNLMKPDKPQFIFTDLNMPLMNGWEFLKEIKQVKSFKDIPVFILSTSTESKDRSQSIVYGAAGFFTKPATVQELKAILEKAVHIIES